MGIGDTGNRIGHARARRHQCDTQFAGQFGMGLSHVNGGAFVTYVNDADSLRVKSHPDRHDVSAAEGKYALDAALLEEARDEAGRTIGRHFHFTTPVLFEGTYPQCDKRMDTWDSREPCDQDRDG